MANALKALLSPFTTKTSRAVHYLLVVFVLSLFFTFVSNFVFWRRVNAILD